MDKRESNLKGIVWVKWERMLRDLKFGGLNVGSLRDSNLGLLGKWWWRFVGENQSLWVKIVKSIFGSKGGLEGGRGRLGPGGRGSSAWGGIVSVGKDLKKLGIDFAPLFGKEVGNGV